MRKPLRRASYVSPSTASGANLARSTPATSTFEAVFMTSRKRPVHSLFSEAHLCKLSGADAYRGIIISNT
jgi:hypothetical protein